MMAYEAAYLYDKRRGWTRLRGKNGQEQNGYINNYKYINKYRNRYWVKKANRNDVSKCTP